MNSMEVRQIYTGIDMPGERWRQLNVHVLDITFYIHTFKHNIQL